MTQMKAVGIYEHLPIEEPNSLVDLTVATPAPREHDLLVEVKAISVNPIDTKVRKRKPATDEAYPKILGWDVAGVVSEVGRNCTLFQKGDEVFYAGDISRPGGNSQFHVVDERIVGRKPRNLSFAESAALPLTSLTASESLWDPPWTLNRATTESRKTLLIIGAAGGVRIHCDSTGETSRFNGDCYRITPSLAKMVFSTRSRPYHQSSLTAHSAVTIVGTCHSGFHFLPLSNRSILDTDGRTDRSTGENLCHC